MPEKKPASTVQKRSSKTASKTAVRKKRPTLAEQVKEKNQVIHSLKEELKAKEVALAQLSEQAVLADEMSQQLKTSAESVQAANQLVSEQAKQIEMLMILKKEKEKEMASNAEQEQLIEELTNKLLDVDIKLTAASIQNNHVTAKNVVKSHMIAGMSLGLIPAPLFDIAALTGTQVNMLRTLCKQYEVDFDEQKGKALLTSLVGGSLPVMTVLGLSSVVKLIPGVGTVGGGLSMSVLSGASIYATGQVIIRHFDLGGTLEDFDSKYWQKYFKEEFEEGKLFVKNLTKKNNKENSVIG